MYDAVVVGAGLNGLAAGVVLARAGWKVLILEREAKPGGAVRTEEVTLPGFRHDLHATNLNAFAGSAFAQAFAAELGITYIRAAKAFCSVFPDGDLVGVSSSLEETCNEMERLSRNDAAAWRRLTERFRRDGASIVAPMRQPMPSWHLLKAVRHLPLVLQSSGRFVRRHFEHPKVQALVAAWGMHLDFPPHVAGGALYPFLASMAAQANGIVFGTGGAGAVIDALAALFRSSGGELRCSCAVTQITVEGGAATGIVSGGERIAARKAVIANLAPQVLFDLVKIEKRGRFRHGPGTMMIHLALSELAPWRNSRARGFAYVHIAPSLEGMSETYRRAMRGELPEEPVLVVAQPTVFDPSRAPPGKHVLSIQVRAVPPALDKEACADRVTDLVERYAPGLRARTLARCVLSPQDLEGANPNLVGGDSIGGSHHLGQQFIFRPFLGWSRYRTPVKQLYLCGASTWPGAGTGAASGWLLGRMLAEVR